MQRTVGPQIVCAGLHFHHFALDGHKLCCGRQVGCLRWEPPAAPEARRNIKIRSSDDHEAMISAGSNPNLIGEFLLGCQERSLKSRGLSRSRKKPNDGENSGPASPRRSKEVEEPVLNPGVQREPLLDDDTTLVTSKSSVEKVPKCEVLQCSNSEQSTHKHPRKKPRLRKKSVCGSILHYLTPLDDNMEEATDMRNASRNNQDIENSNISDIAVKSGCEAIPADIGMELTTFTGLVEDTKVCNEVQRFDLTTDTEMINDIGLPLPLSLPVSSPASEISCAICWTDSSSSRGVLPCGHRFCFVCIRRWANETVSKKKEPVCPLCMASFAFITVKNHATSSDQKIFSQSVPEFSEENVYLVLGQRGFATQQNLQCNICNSRDAEELLLRCNTCGRRAVHTFCLDPPLPPVPDERWSCSFCVSRRRPFYDLP